VRGAWCVVRGACCWLLLVVPVLGDGFVRVSRSVSLAWVGGVGHAAQWEREESALLATAGWLAGWLAGWRTSWPETAMLMMLLVAAAVVVVVMMMVLMVLMMLMMLMEGWRANGSHKHPHQPVRSDDSLSR